PGRHRGQPVPAAASGLQRAHTDDWPPVRLRPYSDKVSARETNRLFGARPDGSAVAAYSGRSGHRIDGVHVLLVSNSANSPLRRLTSAIRPISGTAASSSTG